MESSTQNENFYRAFEDKFRGSRNEIRARLEAYSPFLEAILPYSEERLALDLGCGRGEWLELLRDRNFAAKGVDLDERMLAASRERDLTVERMDAIEAISAAQSNTLAVVSGFHIAEHLPFDKLQVLISEALRALVPGGLLILETPNPENLKVSSHTFHLDPTHQKPLPPALLQFMTDYYGFARSKIIRLQEKPSISQATSATLEDFIFGVSPDYAVVAQKSATADLLNDSNNAFSLNFGLSDHDLIRRFELNNQDMQSTVQQLIEKLQKMNDVFEREMVAQQRLLNAMQNSTSWKITAPLRSFSEGLGWLWKHTVAGKRYHRGSSARKAVQFLLTHSMLWVKKRPSIARFLLKILRIFPGLERRLILAAQARGLALSLRPKDTAGVKAWNLDVEPDLIRKFEELRKTG